MLSNKKWFPCAQEGCTGRNEHALLHPALKIIIRILAVLVGIIIVYEAVHLIWLRDVQGWAILSWMENVAEDGPSTKTAPENIGSFSQIQSFNGEKSLLFVDILTLSSLALTVVAAWMLWARKRKPARSGRWRKSFFAGLAVFLGVTALALSGMFSKQLDICLLYTSPSPRDPKTSRMPSSA